MEEDVSKRPPGVYEIRSLRMKVLKPPCTHMLPLNTTAVCPCLTLKGSMPNSGNMLHLSQSVEVACDSLYITFDGQ